MKLKIKKRERKIEDNVVIQEKSLPTNRVKVLMHFDEDGRVFFELHLGSNDAQNKPKSIV